MKFSRNQGNNLLYLICLHETEFANFQESNHSSLDVFTFDLDNRLIFIPRFTYKVMHSEGLSNLS